MLVTNAGGEKIFSASALGPNSFNVQPHSIQAHVIREVKGLPIAVSKSEIRGSIRRWNQKSPNVLAFGRHDPNATGTRIVDVAFFVDSHAIRYPRSFIRTHIQPNTSIDGTVIRLNIEAPDLSFGAVVDVEEPFIRRNGNAVRVLQLTRGYQLDLSLL